MSLSSSCIWDHLLGDLDSAFAWICRRRCREGHNGDIWDLRRHWSELRRELYESLAEWILHLVYQHSNRTTESCGRYWSYTRGLPRGSPLSPILGAIYLMDLDRRMEEMDVFYVRYMDDILILAKTRWKLRKAVRAVNEELATMGLEKHPDKTFIGCATRGFDFLGYRFEAGRLTLAKKTIQRFEARCARLQEQEGGPEKLRAALGDYVRRWVR